MRLPLHRPGGVSMLPDFCIVMPGTCIAGGGVIVIMAPFMHVADGGPISKSRRHHMLKHVNPRM